MAAFLAQAAGRIPTLCGLQFCDPNLPEYAARLQAGDFDILFGVDEMLLGVLAMGATYNFAARHFSRLMYAFRTGDLGHAQELSARSVRGLQILEARGVVAAGKTVMTPCGLDCGPVRAPLQTIAQPEALLAELRSLPAFFP